jgi:hypothetical protein
MKTTLCPSARSRSTICLSMFSSTTIFTPGRVPSDIGLQLRVPRPQRRLPHGCPDPSGADVQRGSDQSSLRPRASPNQFHGDPSSCHSRLAHHDFRISYDQRLRHMSTVYRDLPRTLLTGNPGVCALIDCPPGKRKQCGHNSADDAAKISRTSHMRSVISAAIAGITRSDL